MIRPKLEGIYQKSVMLTNLLNCMTVTNMNIRPSKKEYLSDIYILLNIYEYITQVLYYRLVSTFPLEEHKIKSCTYLFRVCRDTGIINNEARAFMVSFCYMRNKLCHTYEEVSISDVYTYIFDNRDYIKYMINIADEIINYLDVDMDMCNYTINELISSEVLSYEEMLKSIIFQYGRLLSIRECIEIRTLFDSNSVDEYNITTILNQNMQHA